MASLKILYTLDLVGVTWMEKFIYLFHFFSVYVVQTNAKFNTYFNIFRKVVLFIGKNLRNSSQQ